MTRHITTIGLGASCAGICSMVPEIGFLGMAVFLMGEIFG